jgi:hypothetical protein
MTENLVYTFRKQPDPIGCYDLGGVQFCIYREPSKFQRWWVRRLLGWDWVSTVESARNAKD